MADGLIPFGIGSPSTLAQDPEPVRLAEDPALSPGGTTLAFAWAGDLWAGSDVVLWPEPGEWSRGIDRQRDEAISRLKQAVSRSKDQPRPELRKASERR